MIQNYRMSKCLDSEKVYTCPFIHSILLGVVFGSNQSIEASNSQGEHRRYYGILHLSLWIQRELFYGDGV